MKFEYDEKEPFWLNHARATIISDDLDPVYVAAYRSRAELGDEKLHRFLMAMSLFYHIGFSCEIAEKTTEETFWQFMIDNYEGTKRGTERRYFRGEQGMKCLDYLKAHFIGPTDFLTKMYRPTYSELMKAFESIPAYGPYHIWKIQDFYDRILSMPIEPDTCILHLPAEPIKGSELVKKEILQEVFPVDQLFAYMASMIQAKPTLAPPAMDRPIDIREVETAMCMLKHYYNGSDYVGKDLLDKYESLNGYGPVAEILQKNIPKPVPRDFFSPPAEVVARLGIKLSKESLESSAPIDMFSMFG